MKLKVWLSLILLLTAVVLAYSNIFQNGFLYDDEFLIQKNQNIRTWAGLEKSFLMSSTGGAGGHDSFYRPIQGVLYTVVFQAAGLSTVAFHILNLCLHLINALLIFWLARRLGFGPIGAWIGVLLWSLHPVHTEAITYQSATADPLYTLFILSGLLVLVPRFSMGRMAAAAGLYGLALLSKETAIVFPGLVVACLFLVRSARWNWRTYLPTWPLWALAGVYLGLRQTLLNFDNDFHLYKTTNIYTEHILYRFYTFLATLPSYVRLLFWPDDLHMDRSFPVFVNLWSWPVLLGLSLFTASLVIVWQERKNARPIWAFAILWFFASFVPQSGVLVPVNSLFLEHWLYLPCIGFFICTGECLAVHKPWRYFIWPTTAAAAVALAIVTFEQNRVWATPITFYTHILKFEKGVARVHNNLAMAYSDLGQDDEAIVEYQKAIAISDTYPQTHHNLALALIREKRIDEAIGQLQRALALDKDFYFSANVLAQIYHAKGDEAHATQYAQMYSESVRKFQH